MDNDIIPINQLPQDDVVPINELPTDNQEQPSSKNANTILGLTGLGAGMSGVGLALGAKKGYEALAPQRTKVSGDLINSIIKPRHKEYMFGKNPGQGIAQEGIWGVNLDSIGKKVENRLKELNTYAKEYRSLPENVSKTVDLSKALDPFYEALEELGKAPETHKTKINEIYGMVKDLEGNIPKDMKSVPVDGAYGVKKVVENMQKWNVENQGDNVLNSALKRVYHNIDASIDTELPKLKEVNSRIANLISAKQAIRNRAEILSRHENNLLDLANLPLKTTVGSTAFKSGLAKILSEKFGMVAKKGVTRLMAVGPFLDAIKYANDPEAYIYSLSTGGRELSPKGSQEREIELGRIA